MKSDPIWTDPSPIERQLNPIIDQSENEALDSQFLTSKNSVNDVNDLDEHSGLK